MVAVRDFVAPCPCADWRLVTTPFVVLGLVVSCFCGEGCVSMVAVGRPCPRNFSRNVAEYLDESHECVDEFSAGFTVDDSESTGPGKSRLPDLPGLILVDPNTDVRGQVIYPGNDGVQCH